MQPKPNMSYTVVHCRTLANVGLFDLGSLCRFKEISAVNKEVSRLIRIHPTAVSDLPEAIQVRWNLHL